MFGPVRSVGKGLVAALVFAHIRFLSSMGTQVGFKVFQTRIGLRTAFKLEEERKELLFIHYNRL